MKKEVKIIIILVLFVLTGIKAQTPLTEAVDFHIKTIEGIPYYLFELLDDHNYIVVIDFFSTSCAPCQQYSVDFQESYEYFGENSGNVFFVGINWGSDNAGVHEFDSIYGLNFPSASGIQGGGNGVFNDFEIMSYPTVIVITPNHSIVEQYIWYPTSENIIAAVIEVGGLPVNVNETKGDFLAIYPNPAKNILNIGFDNKTMLQNIDIYHITGKLAMSVKTTTDSSIDISNLEQGNYILVFANQKGILERRKFIVSR